MYTNTCAHTITIECNEAMNFKETAKGMWKYLEGVKKWEKLWNYNII